jgi:hypothetical protein
MAKKDFFISHAKEDQGWGEWIGWHLQNSLDQKVFAPSFEIGPGTNRVLAIQRACHDAERAIVVLSRNFRSEDITDSAWASFFTDDPTGAERLLVPVRIDGHTPKGLFAALEFIDLVGTDEQTALIRLREGIRRGRQIPKEAPPFPNQKGPQFPNAAGPDSSPSRLARTTNSQVFPNRIKPIKPDTLAAMMDKDDQATHALEQVPEEIRRRNGKMFGFVLGGYTNEWPEAALKKIGYGLTGTHEMDELVRIVPLAGVNPERRADAGRFLRQLISKKLACGFTLHEAYVLASQSR